MRAARQTAAGVLENLIASPLLLLVGLVCGATLPAAGPAMAQSVEVGLPVSSLNVPPQAGTTNSSALNARRAVLFKKMMANPADIDLAFEYATLSSQAGDLEGAISTLERMLIFAPDLARLKLELGVLYFRLGSYWTSRGYFEGVLELTEVPPAVTEKAKLFLTAIDEKTQTSIFSGTVMTGAQYHTNANSGPRGDSVTLDPFGFPFTVPIDSSLLAKADTSGFVAGNFHYRYFLPSQGDAFDVNLVTYGSLYSELHGNNTLLAELTFGPDFSLGRFGIPNADLSVYGILGGVVLDGDTYRRSIGAGAKVGKTFDALNRGELRFEYHYLDYDNSDFRPTASERTGNRFDMSGYFEHAFNGRFKVFGIGEAARHDADTGDQSFWEAGGSLGLSYAFDPPISTLPGRWTTTVWGGILRRTFDEPDTSIYLSMKERDTEAFIYGGLTVPLADKWALQTSVGYRKVSSNYELYSFDGMNVSLAIAKRF